MNAYQATQQCQGPSALDEGPGWCFDRFGQSTTPLPDGREILIAGEHEDYYDPDFCIYNDVVVKAPNGEITIYGYPEEVFPPTDFHTATLLPESILLIGSLGYQEDRLGKQHPQILQLTLNDFSVRKIDIEGDSPGWIHRHAASLSDDGHSITISGGMIDPGSPDNPLQENIDDWSLDLRTWRWSRLTDRGWQQWTLRRTDHKPCQLWRLRQAIWMREVGWKDHLAKTMQDLEAATGRAPNLDLIPFLYALDHSVTELPQREDEHNVHRVLIDGLVVRFTEEMSVIRAMVEGQLSPARLQALQESIRSKLSALESTDWVVE
jgi:hypothetical protein